MGPMGMPVKDTIRACCVQLNSSAGMNALCFANAAASRRLNARIWLNATRSKQRNASSHLGSVSHMLPAT